MTGRFPIEDVSPVVSCGRYPAKAVVGEVVPVSARAYREGHDALGCNVVWLGPDGVARPFTRMRPGEPGQDRWHATIRPDAVGLWRFAVEAFGDPYLTWQNAVTKKIAAGQGAAELANDLAEGVRVLTAALDLVPKADRDRVCEAVRALADDDLDLPRRVSPALDLADLLWEHPVRELVTTGEERTLWVDRPRALFSAWYEFFPRSEGAIPATVDAPARSGTFATAMERLPGVAAMGFDVLYLPPIHPIGRVNRKGRNNALTAGPDDVGSPWAIGAAEGGHDAIHPDLGTPEDFRDFVAAAAEQGLEVAMDLALQCAPDHPWVTEHPEWFTTRIDGSIAYAENPPKKYQDIYPLNFDNDPAGLYAEIRRVLQVWIDHGVTLFRVDNPHTKPLDFWQWLLADVARDHPEVIFLSEAFTRPATMLTLAKVGFHQSYTYFTWRSSKQELGEYLQEVSGEQGAWMRPAFWPTTHDILPPYLQGAGGQAWAIRAVLAALGSPTWGIYSGYELLENVARPGADEQIDNEKYEFRPRDWSLAQHLGLADLIGKLNEIRRANPALLQLRNLRVHPTSDDATLAFSRHLAAEHSPTGRPSTVVVVVSLDPWNVREGMLELDLAAFGLPANGPVTAHDVLRDERYSWGSQVYVRIDPAERPAHVVVLEHP